MGRWMRVGLSLNTNAGEYGGVGAGPRENRRFIKDLLGQADEADRLGYDGIFVAERHSRPETRLPDPLQVLLLAAMRTSRCDLVTHVLLLPLHHPCDVAERAAVVDVASGGRLILGVGMGFDERYFRTFAVDPSERRDRFVEGLEILGLAWTGEPFDYNGKHHQIAGGQVFPRPAQLAGPPLWIGGEVRASVERAAHYGAAWVVAWPVAPEKWKDLTEHYWAECDRVGKDPQIVYSRHCWFAESRAEVERWFVPMWLEEMKYYWRRGRLRHPDFASASDFDVPAARKHLIYGNAEDCLEGLEASRAMGIDYLKLSMRLPLGPSVEAAAESMRAFASEVLPKLDDGRGQGAATVAVHCRDDKTRSGAHNEDTKGARSE